MNQASRSTSANPRLSANARRDSSNKTNVTAFPASFPSSSSSSSPSGHNKNNTATASQQSSAASLTPPAPAISAALTAHQHHLSSAPMETSHYQLHHDAFASGVGLGIGSSTPASVAGYFSQSSSLDAFNMAPFYSPEPEYESVHPSDPSMPAYTYASPNSTSTASESTNPLQPAEGESPSSSQTAPKRSRENRYRNAPPGVISRRRAQNRASQRAYRERKEQRIRDLEQMLQDSQQKQETLSQAYLALQEEYNRLLRVEHHQQQQHQLQRHHHHQQQQQQQRGDVPVSEAAAYQLYQQYSTGVDPTTGLTISDYDLQQFNIQNYPQTSRP